ncbi:hypothetical protein FOA52_014633 [Chlamydomonas sp. UWO 241]|nr:hypothetical protein FOA52_014633 [Chlamydomonas sp. UWO 241]
MDDLFGGVHDLEARFIEGGAREGHRDGLAAGIVEGRELGLQKGYEIGLEVGFYSGCVHMWRRLQAQDPAIIPDRASRGLATLEQLLASFPLDDPMDDRLQEAMEKLQGRFKAVASMMGCLQDYFPREGGDQPGGAGVGSGSPGGGSSSGAPPPPGDLSY